MAEDHFQINAFSPSFDPFLVLLLLLVTAFWDFPWPKTRHHGLKTGQKNLSGHPKWAKITFRKTRFSPIFEPFLVPKRPIFKAFLYVPWPKTRHHGLKTGQKHLFEHPKWSRNNFEKNPFFVPGDTGGPTSGPHCARAVLPSGYTK